MLGKKEVLGIDIGSRVIKMLELKTAGNKIAVSNYAEYDIGLQALEEKSPDERRQAYIDALKRIISKNKFTSKNAAISVSGSSVIVRFVKFPKMTAADLKKSLQFEAEPHIPFDIQEVYMDTHIIGDIEGDSEPKMEAVLVAGKKETIQDKIEIIEKAGFRPAIVDVDAFALETAYECINKEASNEMVMLVNIGANITNICIVENGISKVVRDLYTAGNNFTRMIQDNLQNTMDAAEELKRKYGLLGTQKDEAADDENLGQQVFDILYPLVKELNSEIQRSIDYFTGQQTVSDVNIEKIILSGGSAQLKGLAELISSDLKMPVEIFRPLESFSISGLKKDIDVTSPALAVVTGLALRRIDDHKSK